MNPEGRGGARAGETNVGAVGPEIVLQATGLGGKKMGPALNPGTLLELPTQERGGLRREGGNEITVSEDRLFVCRRRMLANFSEQLTAPRTSEMIKGNKPACPIAWSPTQRLASQVKVWRASVVVFIRLMEFFRANAVGKQEVPVIPEGGCNKGPWHLSQIRPGRKSGPGGVEWSVMTVKSGCGGSPGRLTRGRAGQGRG